jgi:hypothetical protein
VVVPDFARDPLALSGVLIVRGGAEATVAGREGLAAGRATTVRQFLPTDQVTAVASVHQGGRQPLLSTRIEMRITDAIGRVRVSRSVTMDPDAFGSLRGADVRLDLPLADLEPGEHLVSLEATSARGTAQRDVRIAVR